MGRRRWRFLAIAAFLLYIVKDSKCQDESDFYYTPVERNFAQVQPPIYSNSRPTTYFENGDNFRVPASTQQQYYNNEGHVKFPSPNYNQNPSPFALPTGRSQSGGQFYINQPEFTPQRQRFRQSLPYNFKFVHPASTKKPDLAPIHSLAYQNDPSKPETFLGQITINNPDIDYLQNLRFKNVPFDGNSLKNNGLSGHINHDDNLDNNQDLYDRHRVTTYNPKKLTNNPRVVKPNGSRYSHFESPLENEKSHYQNNQNKLYAHDNSHIKNDDTSSHLRSSTEYKGLLDLEPLLEDDISDMTSFRELMKNPKASFDVQVIKSNTTEEDSKPDASSMNTDNLSNDTNRKTVQENEHQNLSSKNNTPINDSQSHQEIESEEDTDGTYVEYDYEEVDSTETPKEDHTVLSHSSEPATDIYDDYDETEEPETVTEETISKSTEAYDILVMKSNKTLVKDDNFKQFVDTTIIDQTDISHENFTEAFSTTVEPDEDVTSLETPSILGQEVVSVVTTKSVVNGTISIPDVTYAPSTTKISNFAQSVPSEASMNGDNSSIPVTTENYVVVASVQTSRSVSGARFLPFPTVEQEEKKQVLTDDEDSEENVTQNPEVSYNSSSTENINDKLDSIQSELSSALLSKSLDNKYKNIELLTESTTPSTPNTTEYTTTTALSLNVFTLKSTQLPTSTERSSPDPLPVMIKKFTPRVSTSTTQKPKKKLVTIMDDLAGFLPAGYKQRFSYKDKRTSTTTTTTTTTTPSPPPTTTSRIMLTTTEHIINETQGRSSGISSKNRVILLDDKSLLPKEYNIKENKHKENKPQDDLISKFQPEDISKFLPPGYKPEPSSTTENILADILSKAGKVNLLSFLPKGYNNTAAEKSTEKPNIVVKAQPVDISAFLPAGFKLNSTSSKDELPIETIKIADISSLLPPGFSLNTTEEPPVSSSTTKAPGGSKLVFPTRIGSKPKRITTPRPNVSSGPVAVTPKIQKGWPTRASTEFTGWPSPSTTPFSIEKLLEAQRNATATTPMTEFSTESTTKRVTSTTTTTTVPPPPTTPGICQNDCDIAATIKLVAGVQWVPELLDHHTEEWQKLANDIKDELNSVYSKSDLLKKWYKGIRIDGFSQGSVLVDYFIELNEVKEKVNTVELKKLFHQSLHEAKNGSVVETVTEMSAEESFDPDVMLGDQPSEERMKKSDEKMTKTIDKSAGKLEIGKFVMDPVYTEFIVLPKREEPKLIESEEESFLPQWGIAVIVIAMASLLFVVIFGVTVLVNRQKSAKAKQPIPLSEDMLRELDKSHMGGYDDMHQMKERELPYAPSGKRMSTAFIEQLAYPNPGDSWRSEWTPQLQKYMQHYTPDSGRGSQIYGAGNPYGYSGSQLYGQTGGGGGSQIYGYSGEYPVPRSHYSRRRSEYDSNF